MKKKKGYKIGGKVGKKGFSKGGPIGAANRRRARQGADYAK
jgi:hypothetical protein